MSYEWEWIAEEAVKDLESVLDTKKQIVKEGHNFIETLDSLGYIMMHLTERIKQKIRPKDGKIPKDASHLRSLDYEISMKIATIIEIVQSNELKGMRFKNEERVINVSDAIKHKDIVAVKDNMNKSLEEEKEEIELKVHELEEIHKRFKEIIDLIDIKELESALDEDFGTSEDKDTFKRIETYYFNEIYKFIRTYESVFRSLLKKEKALAEKVTAEKSKIR